MFQNMSIRVKLLISYLCVTLIPIIVFCMIMTSWLRENTMEKAIQEARDSSARVEERIQSLLSTVNEVSNQLCVDEELYQIATTQFESPLECIEALNDYKTFQEYENTYPEIDVIKFYVQNDTLLNSGHFINPGARDLHSLWYSQAKRNNGKVQWWYMSDESYSDSRLALIRSLYNYDGEFMGVVKIYISNRALLQILEQENFDSFLITNYKEAIGTKASEDLKASVEEVESSRTPVDQFVADNGVEYRLITSSFSSVNDVGEFKIVSVFPVEDILKNVQSVEQIAILIIFASVLISCIIIFIITYFLCYRISQISENVHMVASGVFNNLVEIKGNDEVGQLSQDLEVMAGKLQNLIAAVKTAEKQKSEMQLQQKDIQFKMLVSQINPHFLFNTLESIRMSALVEGARESAEMVKLLGKLLRSSIEINSVEILLKDEIATAESYLKIQSFRYRKRLEYTIDTAAVNDGYKVIPYILQPIVENSIIHGMEEQRQETTIALKAYFQDEKLVLEVADNGVGMTEEKLQELRELLEVPLGSTSTHIGMRNVHQRIRFHYGPEYGLEIQSEYKAGTVVKICLPGVLS